ncbi:acetyl-CoA carboxylase biotin carboxylase subunit family protein [Streptomyces qinglanensis]|uniref:acetyl-CoA carboxylase biotin carboxylase subunit family protein n=1 Tax=Streptomyces qinglanensis TaxID=943816 RepID=UPI0037938CA6
MSSPDGPLAVVYDHGSASAGELVVGLAPLGPLLFLVRPSEHGTRTEHVLAQAGRTVRMTDDPRADARALAAERPRALLTFAESELRTAAELAALLGLPFHSRRTAAALTDKVVQRTTLRRAGVATARGIRVHQADGWRAAVGELGLPLVVKPPRGRGSAGVRTVSDRAEAEQLAARLFPAGPHGMLVEEYLRGRSGTPHGDYVSVETVTTGSGTVPLAVTGKHPLVPPFRETGQFWPAGLIAAEHRAVCELAVSAVTALGVTTGICHTEVKLTPGGPRLIEVNGRLGGHLNELARRACGVDLVEWAGRIALGAELPGTLPPVAGVHFQYNSLAPIGPCTLLATHGAKEARAVPGVHGHRPYLRPPGVLPGGIGSTHLDLLWGAADDHGTMVRVLERALSRLGHEFRFKDGSIGTVHSRLTAPFPAVLCGPARPPEPEDGALCGAVPGAG